MSFALTTEQVRKKIKFVTRRLGWWFLEKGDLVQPVEKTMGLKKGEKIKRINGPIRIISTRKEQLVAVTHRECEKEGFPELSAMGFIWMFQQHNKGVGLTDSVNRIAFEYLPHGAYLIMWSLVHPN